MATNVDCSACEELREKAPNFVQNGVTSTECASLKNDTGFNPNLTTLHTDCEDLDTANDCLVGMMDGEIEKYEACDWQKFMHKFIPNLYYLLKSGICAICGIWTNIHNLWEHIEALENKTDRSDCIIDYLSQGTSFAIGEEPTDGSYVVAGKGISYLEVSAGDLKSDIYLLYIAGGLMTGHGSLIFHRNNFTDAGSCWCFDDDGVNPTYTQNRKGNPLFADSGKYASGGELLYEIRMKRSQYPVIKSIFSGFGMEGDGGAFHVKAYAFGAGRYAYGQHGDCHDDGTPYLPEYSHGHLVPDGWIYIQIRLSYTEYPFTEGVQQTPTYWMGVRMNQDKIEC